jgi:hypothetical protein
MDVSAPLLVNGVQVADLFSLLPPENISGYGGRNGYVRIDAAGGAPITSITIQNTGGDG